VTIGERIKEARKKKGLNQKELAEKTGLSIGTIQGYEQGRYEPKRASLEKIAFALEVTAVELLGETPLPTTPTDHTESRLNQLMEECGELISAAARYRRHLHGDRTLNEKYTERRLIADITEEIADVTLVASDVRRALGISEEELYKVINEKMKRTEERQ
jgi:transcriptional regulator with XRE-family HTH domain